MADVFVAYKREDHARVAPLVDALERSGLSVWWDQIIPGGASWRQTILTHLDSARCVVVVWSTFSVSASGEFVQEEADRARSRKVLLPIRIDDVVEPLGFGSAQSLDLIGWDGRPDDFRVLQVISAAQAMVACSQPQLPTPGAPALGGTRDLPRKATALVSNYLTDLFQLTSGPKQFVADRVATSLRGWNDGLVFYLLSLLLVDVAELFLEHAPVSQRLTAGVLFFATTLSYGYAAYFSWRLVGARIPIDQFFAIFFYLSGVLRLILAAGYFATIGVAHAIDPAGLEELHKATQSGKIVNILKNPDPLMARPGWALVSVVAVGCVACMCVWMIAGWGAFRARTGLSRWRSRIAFMLFFTFSIPIGAITFLIVNAVVAQMQ